MCTILATTNKEIHTQNNTNPVPFCVLPTVGVEIPDEIAQRTAGGGALIDKLKQQMQSSGKWKSWTISEERTGLSSEDWPAAEGRGLTRGRRSSRRKDSGNEPGMVAGRWLERLPKWWLDRPVPEW